MANIGKAVMSAEIIKAYVEQNRKGDDVVAEGLVIELFDKGQTEGAVAF